MRTTFNTLVINLVVAEFMIACYGIPVDFMASWQRGWKMGKVLCQVTGFVLTTAGTHKNREIVFKDPNRDSDRDFECHHPKRRQTYSISGEVSITTLAVISVHRFIALTWPKSFNLDSRICLYTTIISIWIYALLMSVPPWFGWGEFVPERSGMT